jgi:hypothetical protein
MPVDPRKLEKDKTCKTPTFGGSGIKIPPIPPQM